MTKIYSANLVYKNYLEYFKKTIMDMKLFIIIISSFIIFFLISLLGHALNSKSNFNELYNLVSSSLLYSGYAMIVILLIIFLVSFIVWKQVLIFDDSTITSTFPSEKQFQIRFVEYIVLDSPNIANIVIKTPDLAFKTVLICHIKNKQNWIDLVSFIKKIASDIDERVYVRKSYWKNSIAKSTTEESYNYVEKLSCRLHT